jgi:hypothetical protein
MNRIVTTCDAAAARGYPPGDLSRKRAHSEYIMMRCIQNSDFYGRFAGFSKTENWAGHPVAYTSLDDQLDPPPFVVSHHFWKSLQIARGGHKFARLGHISS